MQNFVAKWRSDQHLYTCYKQWIRSHRGDFDDMCVVTDSMLEGAFKKLKAHRKLDCEGICVAVLKKVAELHVIPFKRAMSMMMWDIDSLCCMPVQGRIYGKESCVPPPHECRAILPLTACHSIVDYLLSEHLLCALPRMYKIPRHVLIGGQKGTQCLDIA